MSIFGNWEHKNLSWASLGEEGKIRWQKARKWRIRRANLRRRCNGRTNRAATDRNIWSVKSNSVVVLTSRWQYTGSTRNPVPCYTLLPFFLEEKEVILDPFWYIKIQPTTIWTPARVVLRLFVLFGKEIKLQAVMMSAGFFVW